MPMGPGPRRDLGQVPDTHYDRNVIRTASLLLALSLAGCASSPYTPSADRTFEDIPEFQVLQGVELSNGQPSTDPLEVGGRMIANLREWTDVAIEIAGRELGHRGARIGEPGKSLELAVTGAVHDRGWWTLSTTIDMHVRAGNGFEADYRGVNSAAMTPSPGYQADGAMMRVVKELLSDPEIVRYLTDG